MTTIPLRQQEGAEVRSESVGRPQIAPVVVEYLPGAHAGCVEATNIALTTLTIHPHIDNEPALVLIEKNDPATGLIFFMTADGCRSLAAMLLRVADHVDGGRGKQ